MNDERAMILKMLQEGKLSVEEADALLDVLNDSEQETEGGFASEDATRESGREPGSHARESDRRAEDAKHGFQFDVDLSGLKETLRTTMSSVRDAMSGVSDSLKDAFSGIGEFDFSGFARAMGRERADGEQTLLAETGAAGTLTISNKWGDVRVTGVDATQISGTVRISCWAEDVESAHAELEKVKVRLEQTPDGWKLESDQSTGRATRIDLELEVPTAFDVAVTTASGDLWLETLSGSQTVNTMSGDISVATLGSDSGGRQLVNTKSGDVVAAALVGEVKLSTLSGDVSVEGFSGSLDASTKSGDIRVTGGHGSLRLSALSGDIAAAMEELGDGGVVIGSLSGDTRLELPDGAPLHLDVKATSGDLHVDLELDEIHREKRRVHGTRGDGSVPVEVSNVSGDVHVSDS